MLLPSTVSLFLIVKAGPITPAAMAVPPLSTARSAWKHHMADLLEQHRWAHEITDDEFGIFISRFYDAQTACDSGRLTEGLAIYDHIPLAAVRDRPLR